MQQFAACPFGGLPKAIALQLANLSCFAVHEPERLWEFAPSAEQNGVCSLSCERALYGVLFDIEA